MSWQGQPQLLDLSSTGDIGALDASLVLDVEGVSGAKAAVSGTWSGTIKFEGSIDGTRWDPVGAFDGTNGSIVSQTGVTTNTIVVFVGISGLKQMRARFHTYSSGAATVTLRASNGVSNVFADNLIPANFKVEVHPKPITITSYSGTAISTSTQVMPANANRKYLLIQNPTTNTMWIDFTVAAISDPPSIKIGPNEKIEWSGSVIPTEAITCIRNASVNVSYTAKEG